MTLHTKELAFDLIRWKSKGGSIRRRFEWKYLSEGVYREVWIGEDGLVYKVPLEFDYDDISENETEYKNYCRMRKMPVFEWKGNKWVIPSRMGLFKFPSLGIFYDNIASVSVMPLIKGEFLDDCADGCGAQALHECLEYGNANYHYEMFDLGHKNVLVQPDGTRVIVDLQC